MFFSTSSSIGTKNSLENSGKSKIEICENRENKLEQKKTFFKFEFKFAMGSSINDVMVELGSVNCFVTTVQSILVKENFTGLKTILRYIVGYTNHCFVITVINITELD